MACRIGLSPASPYRVTISLTQPGMKLAGFQLTARFKDDGAQAGTLAKDSSSDARVGIEAQSGIQYAGQRREGAAVVAPERSRWTVIWTAPSATRAMVFHVAANAANGDERADGDYVYTLTREIQPTVHVRRCTVCTMSAHTCTLCTNAAASSSSDPASSA